MNVSVSLVVEIDIFALYYTSKSALIFIFQYFIDQFANAYFTGIEGPFKQSFELKLVKEVARQGS